MNELEATRAKLKCLEMVEGTELKWWQVVKSLGMPLHRETDFELKSNAYEFALGIAEGKPVWEGDIYYDNNGCKCLANSTAWPHTQNYWNHCTWNPPKPETAMVELLLADIHYWGSYQVNLHPEAIRLYNACRKALEEMK